MEARSAHKGRHRAERSGADVARVLGGLDGARITKRITSSRVDIRDVLMLVLHQFLWLFVRLSIHVTAQTRSDCM